MLYCIFLAPFLSQTLMFLSIQGWNSEPDPIVGLLQQCISEDAPDSLRGLPQEECQHQIVLLNSCAIQHCFLHQIQHWPQRTQEQTFYLPETGGPMSQIQHIKLNFFFFFFFLQFYSSLEIFGRAVM